MLRTKDNEGLATLYISNIAYLRPHLFCCKFHSLKMKEYNKKKLGMTSSAFPFSGKLLGRVWLSVTNDHCAPEVTEEFSGSTQGIWLHWKLQGTDHIKSSAAARLPLIPRLAHF